MNSQTLVVPGRSWSTTTVLSSCNQSRLVVFYSHWYTYIHTSIHICTYISVDYMSFLIATWSWIHDNNPFGRVCVKNKGMVWKENLLIEEGINGQNKHCLTLPHSVCHQKLPKYGEIWWETYIIKYQFFCNIQFSLKNWWKERWEITRPILFFPP